MKHRNTFDIVVQQLKVQRSTIVEELRRTKGDADLLKTKLQLDRAIECLLFCEKYQVHPDCEVLTLPWPRDAFGEFLIVEADETGEASDWNPVLFNGEAKALGPGDIVLRLAHVFNLSTDHAHPSA